MNWKWQPWGVPMLMFNQEGNPLPLIQSSSMQLSYSVLGLFISKSIVNYVLNLPNSSPTHNLVENCIFIADKTLLHWCGSWKCHADIISSASLNFKLQASLMHCLPHQMVNLKQPKLVQYQKLSCGQDRASHFVEGYSTRFVSNRYALYLITIWTKYFSWSTFNWCNIFQSIDCLCLSAIWP